MILTTEYIMTIEFTKQKLMTVYVFFFHHEWILIILDFI